ncbi:transglutaminaseTgpA domain-containing protein [Streptomyces sp. cg28]|uniref:transglutaminase family protein n=1 Tax=Streptomyces sp. cg28 TaxID=3403457 RepID=UPI003B211724
MSGGARLSICATLATLLASCSLLPLVDTSAWLLEAAILLTIQAAVGAVARRVPLARPLTIAAQALVSLLLLTVSFAREQAIGAIVPGPDAFKYFGLLLEAGGDDVSRYAIPAPVSDGIRLMLVGGALVIGLAVDALAVTFRSAAPAGLPLLALYSVAAGLSEGGLDWLWFLLAAGGYLVLLLAEGRDRLSQWGRVFGGAGRGPGRAPVGDGPSGATAPVRTGRRIGAVSLGIALVVAWALPALNGGVLGPSGSGVGAGSGGGGTISAVNPLVSLQNSLNQPEDRTVMTYRTNAEQTSDLYLRIVSLDEFDGTTWRPSVRSIGDVPSTLPTPPGLGPDIRRTEVETNIKAADWYSQDWLPMPYPASKVSIDGRWRFEEVGRTLVGDHGQTTRGKLYSVKSLVVQPTAQQLANAGQPPDKLLKEFTKVPASLPDVVSRTAVRVTRGAANDYERAVKLQDYFAVDGGFTYNTDVQAGSGSAAIVRFLKQKEGFCVHFAFSMAAMARTLGIPARVAVGFTPGSASGDGTYTVGLRDAHAWPELYFEGVGWTRFEPTPTRGFTPEYTQDNTPTDGSSVSAAPSESASDSAASDAPLPMESCSRQQRKEGQCAALLPTPDPGPQDDGQPVGSILLVTLAVLLAVLVPLLPMLWRLRVRARRLGSGGRADVDVAGAGLAARREAADAAGGLGIARDVRNDAYVTGPALAAWREVTDTAWDHGIAPDDSQTPRKAAARIVRLGQLKEPAADAVRRVAAAVEQALYAPRPQPVTGLGEDVRRVHAGLHAEASRMTRLRATLAPRSAIRVVWALAERRARFTAGLRARWTAARSRLSGQEG